jgi:hypothetical protein
MHDAMSAPTRVSKSVNLSTGNRGCTTNPCAACLGSVIHAGSSANVLSGCRITRCSVPACCFEPSTTTVSP